jgi:hypothetical protein
MNKLDKRLFSGVLIIAVAAISFTIGVETRPIPEIEQKPITAADSLFDAQWAQYEADIAKDTTTCVIGGQVCKQVPNLAGFIDWKNKHNGK